MKHSITKICADSLRAYLNEKHGIKLKSGHAHEIVAAFFGYKSKIASLSDSQFPLDNLESASFVVVDPTITWIDQRLASLEGLPFDLPTSEAILKGIYQGLSSHSSLSEKIFHDFHGLSLSIADERLKQHTSHLWINQPVEWIKDVKIERTEAVIMAVVTYDYPTNEGKRHNYCSVKIDFPRVAGAIGFGDPNVLPTFYSGQMRDPEFRMKSSTL